MSDAQRTLDLTASAAAQLGWLASGDVTAEALLEAHVARSEQVNSRTNAVVATDLAQARAAAAEIDRKRAAGDALGPLAGLPMTIKDSFDVNGMPAVCGNPDFANRATAVADALAVARAREAGAVIWGKTNAPFMAGDVQTFNKVYGVTNNPHDAARTSGGSSGGAAAALATAVTPLEIGSDIGGSLRNPAHFCGVCSLKPTYGLIPDIGHVPPSPGLDMPPPDLNCVGPMARNVADLELLFDVLAPDVAPLSTELTSLREVRAALWFDEPAFFLSKTYRAALGAVGEAVTAAGASVSEARPEIDMEELFTVYTRLLLPIIFSEAPKAMIGTVRALRPIFKALGSSRYSLSNALATATQPEREFQEALSRRAAMKKACDAFFERHDVLIAPVTPTPAPPHNTKGLPYGRRIEVDGEKVPYLRQLDWIALATACHLPAVVIPTGKLDAGLPMGVQLIGREGDDRRLLAIAKLIEAQLAG
ncbi:MAG: amidase family protein [Pseudomonadota bacterium]